MTIYDAIKKECNNDFFVEKTETIKNYKDAINHFYCSFILPGLRDCRTENVSTYNNGHNTYYAGGDNALNFNISISTKSAYKNFLLKLKAEKSKERNGWYIQLSQNEPISMTEKFGSFLFTENLEEFVSKWRMAEIQDKIDDLQKSLNEIKESLTKE